MTEKKSIMPSSTLTPALYYPHTFFSWHRDSGRHCCKGHASILWELPKIGSSQKPCLLRSNWIYWNASLRWDLKQACKLPALLVGWGTVRKRDICKRTKNIFIYLFILLIFFFLGIAYRLSRASHKQELMAQTHGGSFEVSLMCRNIKEWKILNNLPKFHPNGNFNWQIYDSLIGIASAGLFDIEI